MRMRKFIAGLALGMSLVMSVNAFAAGSINGIFENVTVDFGTGTDISYKTVEICEEFEAPHFATEAGAEVKALIDEINDGSKTMAEAVPDLKKDDDVTVNIDNLSMLTAINAVVVKDQDGNIIEEGENVAVSFDLTNIPDNAELYVLSYDAAEGFALHKVRSGAVLGDSVRAIIDGNTMTILFKNVKGASFSVLYKTSDDASTTPGGDDNNASNTGAAGHVLPVAMAAIVAGSAVAVFRRKRA